MRTVTAILIENGQIIKQYSMLYKNAVKVVKRGEGRWRDHEKNIIILYPKDADGNCIDSN